MDWIHIDDYPLDKDFSAFISAFAEQGIELRITQEANIQKLWIRASCAHDTLIGYIMSVADNPEPPTESDIQFAIHLPEIVAAHQVPSLGQQAKAAPVTVTAILLSLFGALLVEFGTRDGLITAFWFLNLTPNETATLESTLSSGQLWRLVTPIFIHFGLLHVLINCLWFWVLGARLEKMMGSLLWALFIIITGACSNLTQFLWSESPIFGGMSGVVFALVGFIGVRQYLAPHPLLNIPNAILWFMLATLVLGMTGIFNVFIDGSIGNAAHVGGLIAGAVYALATQRLYR